MTATTELVVPRSMPITFPMLSSLYRPPVHAPEPAGMSEALDSCRDRDAVGSGTRRDLREGHGQHAVPHPGRGPVHVESGRERHSVDEAAGAALGGVEALGLLFPFRPLLASDGQTGGRNAQIEVVALETRNLRRNDHLIVGLAYGQGGCRFEAGRPAAPPPRPPHARGAQRRGAPRA